ncbi:carboxypeptidase-like regulatory domain-containing protein [Halocola ammonii]
MLSRVALLSLLLMFVFQSFAQQGETLRSVVVDSETSEPLTYATVVNLRNGKGTVTDETGVFRLNDVRKDDIIYFSFVGYENRKVEASQIFESNFVALTQRAELVGEVIISADDSYLYDLIREAKKTGTNERKIAKTYFSLQSNTRDKQVELLECYYNGEFAGYDVDKLNLKNGRIALASFEKKYFISTEPSKVLCMYSAINGSDYFPFNPLELRHRELKKSYDLNLFSKYKDEKGDVVYVISFEPLEDERSHFSGKVWIDSLRKDIIKLELSADNVANYPFVPIWPSDSLLKVGMELSKTYQRIDGEMYLKSLDFNYDLRYKHRDGSIDDISTRAVLYAYDYERRFELPFFHFSNPDISDYRKINAIPYNAYFWENFDEFKLNDLQDKNNQFANDPSTVSNREMFVRSAFGEKGFLQQPYVHWSGKRIVFREQEYDKAELYELAKKPPAERYHLWAQIFLDVNQIDDSLHFLTSTIMDPYASYYHFPMDDTARAFINLYFDQIEIERRILNEQLKKCSSEGEMAKVYFDRLEMINRMTSTFLKDVERGLNKQGMRKWNERTVEHLGIDNLALFRVYIEEVEGENGGP